MFSVPSIFVLPVQTQITWNAGLVGNRFLSQKTGVNFFFKQDLKKKKPICCFFKSSKLDQWKPHCCWGLRFVLFVSTMPVNADSSVSSDCTVNRLSSLLAGWIVRARRASFSALGGQQGSAQIKNAEFMHSQRLRGATRACWDRAFACSSGIYLQL